MSADDIATILGAKAVLDVGFPALHPGRSARLDFMSGALQKTEKIPRYAVEGGRRGLNLPVPILCGLLDNEVRH